MEHVIDATNKPIGRVATEAAVVLMGKDTPHYERHNAPDITVKIENASKARIHYKKLTGNTYDRYSGYPGGRKEETMQDIINRKGYSELFRKAVYGMLPSNRLRSKMMKNLIIAE